MARRKTTKVGNSEFPEQDSSTTGHAEVVDEFETEAEAFVVAMLEKQGTNITDESLIKELGSRVADVIRSVK
jgi:transcription initiation factor IIE alpha subunit